MWGEKYAHPGLPPGLKWYGVYGNHDYGQANKECSCSLEHDGSECAQVRRHGYVSKASGHVWYMPKLNYHEQLELPGLNEGVQV